MALLVLRSVGLCVGQNQMWHLYGWLKLFLKNVRWQKIKIQQRWLLGRLSECSLFLSPFYISFCRSFLLGSFFRLAGNSLIPYTNPLQSARFWVNMQRFVSFIKYINFIMYRREKLSFEISFVISIPFFNMIIL